MVGGGEGGEGTTFSEQSPNNKTSNQPDKPDQPSHPLLAREKQGSCCTHHTTPGYTQHTTLLKVGAFGPGHSHLSSPSLSPHHTTPPHHNPGTHLILSLVPSLLHPFNHHPFQTLLDGGRVGRGSGGGKGGAGLREASTIVHDHDHQQLPWLDGGLDFVSTTFHFGSNITSWYDEEFS